MRPGKTPIQKTWFMTKSELARSPMTRLFDVPVGGLADEIAAEQQPRRDLVLFEMLGDLIAGEGRVRRGRRWGSRTSLGRSSAWPRAG